MANQNSVIHSGTKYSPFELMFGRTFDLPSSLTNKQIPTYTYENFVDELKIKLSVTICHIHGIGLEKVF